MAVAVALVAAACASDSDAPRAEPTPPAPGPPAPGPPAPPTTATIATTVTAVPTPTTTSTTASPAVEIAYRVERRSAGGADVADVVDATLTDPRGWQRGGFRLVHRETAAAPYLVVLAEPDEAQALCRPYDVYRKYSCQLGPTVVINADRWRLATPEWTGDLATYQQMLVNHEVGHLLGLKHSKPPCPIAGEPARVMAQQSTELRGCRPNPWPLADEIAIAARHDLPLAPGYDPG